MTKELSEFSEVRLKRDLVHHGIVFAKGTPGTIVHMHDDGNCEVEFTQPTFAVITLSKPDLR